MKENKPSNYVPVNNEKKTRLKLHLGFVGGFYPFEFCLWSFELGQKKFWEWWMTRIVATEAKSCTGKPVQTGHESFQRSATHAIQLYSIKSEKLTLIFSNKIMETNHFN